MRKLALIIALCWGCSSRPEKELIDENSTKIKIDRLYAEIEQSIIDAKRTNENWSLNAALADIRSRRPDLFHLDSVPDYKFEINPNDALWIQTHHQNNRVAVYSPQPFRSKRGTNFVAISFRGDPYLTSSLPRWSEIPWATRFKPPMK